MNMRFVIISTILIAAFTTFISFSLPLTAFAQIENYTPLVGNIPGLTDTSVSGGLVGWISNIYRFLVGVTAVLAIVMIFVAGFQYVVSGDSSGKRQAARDRIAAALGGLLLAVSSFIILNTINPQLVKINLTFEKVKVPESDGIGAVGGGEAARGGAANNPNSFFFGGAGVDPNFVKRSSLGSYYNQTGGSNNNFGYSVNPNTGFSNNPNAPNSNPAWYGGNQVLGQYGASSAAQAILMAAQDAANKSFRTCSLPGTNGGRLACAYAVNEIVEAVTGNPVGGGLSTANMYKALQGSSRFAFIGSDYPNALPGDIIISPTSNGKTGHVGIVETRGAGTIISNSSSNTAIQRNHSASSWQKYYQGTQGLAVYFYRAL